MSGCQGCPVKVTEDDDQNVGHGEGEEIVVHGAVEPRALDDHQDDGQVAQQPRDEDDHVEYCHRPQKSLAKEWENFTDGNCRPLFLAVIYLYDRRELIRRRNMKKK